MPTFTRAFMPGGTFFFTLVTYERQPLFQSAQARTCLREAFDAARQRRPFTIDATVLLPNHLHCIWTLPPDDHDFSTRWRKIKESFTRSFLAAGGAERSVSPGQARKGSRGLWQPRFWEHAIRDEDDWRRHVDYIHFNPVKHGYAACPHAWPWSTFSQWVARRVYSTQWCCACHGMPVPDLRFDDMDESVGE